MEDKHLEWLHEMGKWLDLDHNDPNLPKAPKYIAPFLNEWESPIGVTMPLGFIINCWNEKQYNKTVKYKKILFWIWISPPFIGIFMCFIIPTIYYFLHQQ